MKKAILLFALIGLVSFAWTEPIRVACIGNSITVYHGSYPTLDLDSYPAQMRILMGEGYDIQNFGVSGRTLLKKGDYPIWNEAAFAGALAFQPNVVTIMLGTNDSKPQNWVFKDEFIADYEAMIDTFRALDSHPEIYVCLPAPAFSSKFDISGPIIADEMIPMIQQIIQEKNTKSIDFHTPFLDKGDLFYDGIHPTLDGLWEFAQIFNSALDSANAEKVEMLQDVNLALNKTISAANSSEDFSDLVDGDIRSATACKDGEGVVIDLGAVESTNMFQIILDESVKFSYQVETSVNGTNWNSSIAKATAQDSTNLAIESIEPVDTRYVRFTFHGADATLDPIQVAELRVLKTAPVHAPVLTSHTTKVTAKQAVFNITITSSLQSGYINYSFYEKVDTVITDGVGAGYRFKDEMTYPFNVLNGREKYFWAKFYNNGYEMTSDTLKVDYSIATGVDFEESRRPNRFELHQNYPNPFNPTTEIQFSLPRASQVRLKVFDVVGREMSVLAEGRFNAGMHSVRWNAENKPAGLYFCRLESEGIHITKKMMLLK